eukprot:GHVR01147503.1.p1 GENE.GHVR01147503.1~~GHVR01147503.1.p1  ORF type:complete len:266 (+),score=29.00 GHVR01147503.1:26-799(+)
MVAPKNETSTAFLKQKPLLRGKVHVLILLLSPLWATKMIKSCHHDNLIAIIIAYITTFIFLFNVTTSSMFHLFTWSANKYVLLNRLDHFGIFLMITGSALPVYFAFPGKIRYAVIVIQILQALLGGMLIFLGVLNDHNEILNKEPPSNPYLEDNNGVKQNRKGRQLRTFLYLLMGIYQISFLPIVLMNLMLNEVIYMIVLGAVYIIGGLVYYFRYPNPWPSVFGFHEVFHVCCACGLISTLLVNSSVLQRNYEYVAY